MLARIAGSGARSTRFTLEGVSSAAIGIAGGIAGGTGNVQALGITIVAITLVQLAGGKEAHRGGAAALQHLRLGVAMRIAAFPMTEHHLVDALRHRRIAQRTPVRHGGHLFPLAVRIRRQPIRRALQTAALGDGALRIAAVVVALEAHVRTASGQICVLAAALRVVQMHNVRIAAILRTVNGARQQQFRPSAHINAGRAAALIAAQSIRRIDMPIAQAARAAITGLRAVAIGIETSQAAASRNARRNGGDALVVRLAALLHLQLLAGSGGAFRILGRVAGIAFQASAAKEQLQQQHQTGQQLPAIGALHLLATMATFQLADIGDKEL